MNSFNSLNCIQGFSQTLASKSFFWPPSTASKVMSYRVPETTCCFALTTFTNCRFEFYPKKKKRNQSTKFINWWSAKQLISKIVIIHKQTPTLSTYLLLVMLIHSEACEINDLLIVGCCFNLTNTAYCSHCFLRKSDDKAMRKILSCCVFLLSLWSERQGRRTIWIVSIVSCLLMSSSSHTWLDLYLFYPITQRYSSVQFYHVVIQ